MLFVTGLPIVFIDNEWELSFPLGYEERVSRGPEKHRNILAGPLFPIDLRLSIVKSRICDALYSVRALGKNTPDLVKSIRELDSELEEWRISIPSPERPTIIFNQQTLGTEVDMYSAIQQMNYNFCVSTIHEVSILLCSRVNRPASKIGLLTSGELSVESCRSILRYFNLAESSLVDASLWYVDFNELTRY